MSLGDLRNKFARGLSSLGSPLRIVVIIALCLAVGSVLFWLFNQIIYYYLTKSYVDELAEAFNLNRGYAQALLWVSFAVTTCFAGWTISFSKRKQLAGSAGLVVMLVAHSLAIGTADRNFRASGETEKCYVLTRDSIKILNKVGIDPDTGRECRRLTPEIALKIEQYKTGKRPTLIASTDHAFFSLISGEPIAWHTVNGAGTIEMFDLMGYHPQTGYELLEVNRDVVASWKLQRDRIVKRIPTRVDLEKFMPFDALTGAAQVWFWQSETGDYEFYDGPGYHSRAGDVLKLITRDVLADWKRATEAASAAKKAAQEKADAEARVRAEKDRIEAAAKAEEAKRIRDAEIAAQRVARERADAEARARAETERLEAAAKADEAKKARDAEIAANNARQQSGNECDRLATNPTDSRRAADGVPFDQLKIVAEQAIDACSRATQVFPNELRYSYQLARATQFKDRKRAFEMFSSLVGRGYPAAFDNLGGMYLYDRKDMATATKTFAQGAVLGDADSMVSLADMVDKGFHGQQNPYRTKWALLAKAADLNHAGAQRALAAEQAKLAATQAEQENARRAAEIFGTILGGIARR